MNETGSEERHVYILQRLPVAVRTFFRYVKPLFVMKPDVKLTAAITAMGGYVPDYKLTNTELETLVDTNDEWIKPEPALKNGAF